MSVDLSLETLPEMKVADYIKAFKNKALWKKAKFVLLLMDYKLDGKKVTVAFPFKKPNEAKEAFKKIKKEKLHILKKTGIGNFSLSKDDNNNPIANIEFTLGGLCPADVEVKAEKLFSKLKLPVNFIAGTTPIPSGEEENEEEQPEVENNSDTNEVVAKEGQGKDAALKAEMERMTSKYSDLKNLFVQFKSEIVAKVKDNTFGAGEFNLVQKIIGMMANFQQELQAAQNETKAKFMESLDKLLSQRPILENILKKFGQKEDKNSIMSKTKARIMAIKSRIAQIKTQFSA